jgi:predicted ATP-grasp superfamily ATP-dependent carboligase
MAKATTVLVHEWVTGGGLAGEPLPPSWAAEGSAMRRAIAADFAEIPDVDVLMTLDARLPDEPGARSIVRVDRGEEAEAFARLGAEAGWTVLIAPETGGVLADRTRALERAGGRSLGSLVDGVELAGDKLRLGEFLRARGFNVPEGRRVVPGDGLPGNFSYPAVLKPIDGAGSVDTFWIADAGAIPDEAAASTAALLQPYRPGVPLSASFLVGSDRRARLVGIGQQLVEVRRGRFEYGGGTLPAAIGWEPAAGELQRAVEAVPGLRGFVGVDFVWDDSSQDVTLLEINPRPTTSWVGLARLLPPGRLASAWIDVVEGKNPGGADDLAGIVHSQAALTFRADGTLGRPPG